MALGSDCPPGVTVTPRAPPACGASVSEAECLPSHHLGAPLAAGSLAGVQDKNTVWLSGSHQDPVAKMAVLPQTAQSASLEAQVARGRRPVWAWVGL